MSEEDLNDLFAGQSPFSDFFETFFGSGVSPERGRRAQRAGQRRQRTEPGHDVESDVAVTLAEAYQGVTRVFEVKIPAGVDEGSRVRITGQGAQGTAGRGDLYLRISVVPDPRFTREGMTLRTRVEVPLAAAMLGGDVQVPTPDGRRLLLHVPAGTANGTAFRLRGQGMPRLGQPEQRGDLYAEVAVVLPTHLNAEQRRLFEAFARSLGPVDQATTAG